MWRRCIWEIKENKIMVEKDLFGNSIIEKPIEVNIYADEAMDRKCPYSGNNWHYICLIVERLDKPLLEDIIKKRHCDSNPNDGNYQQSPYFEKNNKIIHWTDLRSADEKNICQRWFNYILDPNKSAEKFYCYILGLNESFLNQDEFDKKQKFNSIYNRFFRTAISYGLKCFFGGKKVIVKNIYHEQGQQQDHEYFYWHPVDKLSNEESDFFSFEKTTITFLTKDHTQKPESNILQLCDCFLGAVVNIVHGLESYDSSRSKYKLELLKNLSELVNGMVNESNNLKSSYQHANRIMIRFFPKEKTEKDSLQRYTNQFYTKRKLKFIEDVSPNKQISLW